MRTRKDGTIICGNLTFNANTGTGHSYGWYEIAKRVNGIQLLNTYNYSTTTARHWHKLLGIIDTAYIEIEAPNGLQDLKGALEHCKASRDRAERQMVSKKRKDTRIFRQLEYDRNKYETMIAALLNLIP